LLARRIEARRARLHREQRVATGAIEPHAMQALRPARGFPCFGEREGFQRRIARHQRFDERRRGRAEIFHARLQLLAEVGGIEAMRIERRRQQVTIRTQALRETFEPAFAVGDQHEARVAREAFSHRARLRRQRFGIATADGHQQQA